MNVSSEPISQLQQRLKIVVPSEEIETSFQTEVEDISPRARLKGFRPGKVPSSVIVQRYGKVLRSDINRRQIDDSLRQALEEQNLNVLSLFNLKFEEPAPGNDLAYEITVETVPTIELPSYSEIEVDLPQVEIDSKAIDQQIERILNSDATKTEKSEAVALGDFCEFSLALSKEGNQFDLNVEAFDALNLDDIEFDRENLRKTQQFIGQQTVVWSDDFCSQSLVGMKPGETKVLKERDPDLELEATLSAMNCVLAEITLDKVFEVKRAKLEDYVKRVGEDDEDQFREHIEKNLESRIERFNELRKRTKIDQFMLEQCKCLMPHQYLKMRFEQLHEQTRQMLGEDADETAIAESNKRQELDLMRDFAMSVIRSELIKLEEITVESNEVSQRLSAQLAMYPNAPDDITKQLYSDENIRRTQDEILKDKFYEHVSSKISILESPMSFVEFEKVQLRHGEENFELEFEVDDVPEIDESEESESMSAKDQEGSGNFVSRFIKSIFGKNKQSKADIPLEDDNGDN